MKIDILTLFPEMFAPLKTSIIGKAVDGGILDIRITDIRQYTLDKHHKCDDYPFGGGAGMVMMPQPIFDAVNAVDPERKSLRIYMSPKGKTLNMPIVKRLAGENRDLLLLCGHYEGVDQRVLDLCFDEEISIGDYVLTGGELPAMVLMDAVIRQLPGAIKDLSASDESFSTGLLDAPHYTRPEVWRDMPVPDVLLSGHHKNIQAWTRKQALQITAQTRPDLVKIARSKNLLTREDERVLRDIKESTES